MVIISAVESILSIVLMIIIGEDDGDENVDEDTKNEE